MDLLRSGRRSYLRASGGPFNPYTAHIPLESQDALNPGSPVSPLPPSPGPGPSPIKPAYTIENLAVTSDEKGFSYTNINLSGHNGLGGPDPPLVRQGTFETP